MNCLYCGNDTSVVNSRAQKRSNQVWRRRACSACEAVFTTHEAIDYSTALLVQYTAAAEPFSADRLFSDILACMPHRSDRYTAAREATSTTIKQLISKQSTAALDPPQISDATARVLKALDKKAYLHYTANHL